MTKAKAQTDKKVLSVGPKRKERKMKPHTRVQGSILSGIERPVLLWLAARMPRWMSPDILTFIGVLGGLLILTGYALSNVNKYYLILASLGFITNWFGDSLDGTLARFRKIERPKYGFFIDHSVDGFLIACVFLGGGLSPFISFHIAAFALTGYLLLGTHVYITTYVTGEFKISYAKLGPTEARLLAIVGNTLIMAMANPFFRLFGFSFTFYDLIVLLIGLVTTLSFIINTVKKGVELSRADRAMQ